MTVDAEVFAPYHPEAPMPDERRYLISDLYHLALAWAPEERGAFLTEACKGDGGLRRRGYPGERQPAHILSAGRGTDSARHCPPRCLHHQRGQVFRPDQRLPHVPSLVARRKVDGPSLASCRNTARTREDAGGSRVGSSSFDRFFQSIQVWDQILGEDVADQQERVIQLERVHGFFERAGGRPDPPSLFIS